MNKTVGKPNRAAEERLTKLEFQNGRENLVAQAAQADRRV